MKNIKDFLMIVMISAILIVGYHFLSPLFQKAVTEKKFINYEKKFDKKIKILEKNQDEINEKLDISEENQEIIKKDVRYIKNGQKVLFKHISRENDKLEKDFKKYYNKIF